MKPFNIKISVNDQEVTLTISPFGDNNYRIIYFGGILGAIHIGKQCKLLPQEQAIGEDLPPYIPDQEDDRIEIDLNEENVAQICEAIVNSKSF